MMDPKMLPQRNRATGRKVCPIVVSEKARARAETAPASGAEERHMLKFMKRQVETTKSFLA
jgi:hypothetical protein